MDLLAQYSDDEGGTAPSVKAGDASKGAGPKGAGPKAAARKPTGGDMLSLAMPMVNAAPQVDLLGADIVKNYAIAHTDKKLLTNPSFAALNKPLQGPVPVGHQNLEQRLNNHKMGNVEKLRMSEFNFDAQYHTFHNFGYGANPARDTRGHDTLVSTEADKPNYSKTVWDKSVKRRRVNAGDAADGDSWAVERGDEGIKPEGSDEWGGFVDGSTVRAALDEDVKRREEEVARQHEEERAVAGEERETKERITSVFHGSKETDYAGRSWIENKIQMPKDVDDKQCFLPKKWIHTWQGHTMGVQQIRWFPKTAHLLLSAGMDAKIMIWDYHNQRKCMRTYTGHDQAVRDINFTADGSKFYSVSYDKNIQYWDTETGQIISTFTNKKTPFCVAVHPDPSQQNIIICGCSNKKAVQWDANSATIVQEYDEHLGAVNTVTFCEEGKRILTSADDKKMFLWEYGIPVVVKHIAEPTMHSIPAIVVGPQKERPYLIGQSMDNKLVCYEAFGKFKFLGKKKWTGHLNAGYAITPGWSPCGKWIMSGDIDGKIWFWDFQKQKNYRVLKAHDGVCMSCLWHPHSTSRVVTAGWDGAIKLWD